MARFQRASSMDTDSGPSRLDGSLRATGEEQGPVSCSQAVYDAVGRNPVGSPTAGGFRDERSSLRCMKHYQIRTWNARGMSLGKLEIVKLRMVSGNRRRGRPRTRWLDTFKPDANMNIR